MEKLEALIKEPQHVRVEDGVRGQRAELLEQIHVMGVIDQLKLFRMLDRRRIPHTWIGAQSSASYLEMWTGAGGNVFYRVTEKALTDLNLGRLIPVPEYSSASNDVMGEDWESEEDTVYDDL